MGKEKEFIPLHSRGKFTILSGSYSNIWLMSQQTPGFSLTKTLPFAHCPKDLPIPWKYTPHAQTSKGQPSCRTELYQAHSKKPSPDLLKQKTHYIRGVWNKPQLNHPFANFGFPFPSNQGGWDRGKLKDPPPIPPPGKARYCKRWWILVCPLSHCEQTHQLALGRGKTGRKVPELPGWSPTKEMSKTMLSTWDCLNHHSPSGLRNVARIKLPTGYLPAADYNSLGSFSQPHAVSHYLCNTALVALLCLVTNSCVLWL